MIEYVIIQAITMKLLAIIPSVRREYGGPAEGLKQQIIELDKVGIDVDVVSLDDRDCDDVQSFPAKVYTFGGSKPSFRKTWLTPLARYGVKRGLIAWLRENAQRYDGVIVNGLWNYATLAARLVLPYQDVPYFVFPHGMLDPWFKTSAPLKHFIKRLSWILCEKTLLEKSASVLFTTEEERLLARSAFSARGTKEAVVGYGSAFDPINPSTQIDAFFNKVSAVRNRRYILFLGRLHPKKGCDLLIDAFTSLAHIYPDFDLVMAGPHSGEWSEKLQKRTVSSNVSQRIHWPGLLDKGLKWGAVHAAAAFILPSHQENFGVAVAEALSAGKPVLISNKVNIWIEVNDAKCGIVRPDDYTGTIELLKSFFEMSEEERKQFGIRAHRLYTERFTVKQAVASLTKVLHEHVSSKSCL